MPALARIEAARVVAASPEAVFAFLSEFENHWRLTPRWVEAVAIEDSHGRVRIRGPLGLRRTATTRVVDSDHGRVIHGTAELSGGTRALVAWQLTEQEHGTRVRLVADVERASLPDRMLLAVGGSSWIEQRFRTILARLDQQLRQPAASQTRATPAASRVQASTQS